MTATALILDKSAARLRDLKHLVTETGCFDQVLCCVSGREALKGLEQNSVDIIFHGTRRVSRKSLSWLARLEKNDSWLDIPVLVFTSAEQPEERISCIEAGAADCLSSRIPERELRARILRFLSGKKRIEKLRTTNKQLARMAITDPLTGIGNRRHFDEALSAELKRNNRSRTPLALLMIDIDHFKRVNDSIGHQGGDGILKIVAETLRVSVRSYDTLCRFGGEEFAIIMPDTSASQAASVAERIRREIAAINARETYGDFPLTVSIGLRAVRETETIEAAQLISEADQALYRAKNDGRNRVEIYRPVENYIFAQPRRPRVTPFSPALSL
ncbi:MAG: diguanylate cyclase [Trichloromonas sp.]|jgi:diguanylate cyclase (GGDEF)-like protein|nr:diguanylate cyclase [Trichloromonas sp.]